MEIDSITKLADAFHYWAGQSIEKLAKAKKKKLDPKAKKRNRGDCVFPAGSSKVRDSADHFPVTSESQARNALSRSHQFSKVPSWYKGSLKSLQDAVRRKVHSKYPGIDIAGKKSKKKSK